MSETLPIVYLSLEQLFLNRQKTQLFDSILFNINKSDIEIQIYKNFDQLIDISTGKKVYFKFNFCYF